MLTGGAPGPGGTAQMRMPTGGAPGPGGTAGGTAQTRMPI